MTLPWRITLALATLGALWFWSTAPQVWQRAQAEQHAFAHGYSAQGETIPADGPDGLGRKDPDRDENLLTKGYETHLAPALSKNGVGASFQAGTASHIRLGPEAQTPAWKEVWITTYHSRYVGRKMRNGERYSHEPRQFTCAVPYSLYPKLKGKWLLFARPLKINPAVTMEVGCRVTDSCGWINGREVRNFDLCRSAWNTLTQGAKPSRVRVKMRVLSHGELPEGIR